MVAAGLNAIGRAIWEGQQHGHVGQALGHRRLGTSWLFSMMIALGFAALFSAYNIEYWCL
jgi:hypothetical protein